MAEIDRHKSTPDYDDPEDKALPDPVPDTDSLDEGERSAAGGDMELVDEQADDEYEYEYVEEIVEVEVDEDGNTISENVTSTTRSSRPDGPSTSRPTMPTSSREAPPDDVEEPSYDDPTAAAAAAFEATSSGHTAARGQARRPPVRRTKGNDNIKSTFAPVLFTVGLLMMVPAIWAVLLLMGYDHFLGIPLPGTNQDDPTQMEQAELMAWVMMACWPIGLILLIAAIVMFVQVAKNKMAMKAEAKAEASAE